MDLASILGILIGISAITGVIFTETGSLSMVIQPDAALIVIGGTLGAGMLNFSMQTLINAGKALKKVFFESAPDFKMTIDQIYELALLARQEGPLIVQELIHNVNNDYLERIFNLSFDTNNHQTLEKIFDAEIEMEEEKGLIVPIFYETLGGYAPTFGIIGAVIGLIQALRSLETPSELGYGISTAFVATLYGVGAANLLLLPIAGKLRYRLREEILYKKLIKQGVLAIHKGENPVLIKENLLNYLCSLEKNRL